MTLVRFVLGLAKAFALLAMINIWFNGAAWSQTARKLGSKPVSVRLCPATCVAVNGHGFKPGGTVSVFERRSGWVRVSAYLDRAKLVQSFGNTITQKPALWIPSSQLASSEQPQPKVAKRPAAKKAVKKKAAKKVVRRDRQRRVTLPKFRPNSVFAARVSQPETVVEQPIETVQQETVVAETQPVVEAPKPVIIESSPVTETSQAGGTSRALTWEELQAKLAEQAAQAKANQSDASKAAEARRAAEAKKAAEKAEADRAAAAQAEAQRQADLAAKQEAERQEAARKQADEASKKAAAKAAEEQAAKDAAAKLAADNAAKAAAAKLAADNAAKAAAAKAAADNAAKVAAAKAAADKAAKDAAAKANTAKTSEGVTFTPPKEEEVAIVLPPKKAEVPEPSFKSADADPISFGKRPKKLTKALLDKRLRKLPGRKSRVRKDAVIALRHYALGLLKSGECKGISGGGPSTTPGMLFVTCTEDPNYQRQFPLEEESW